MSAWQACKLQESHSQLPHLKEMAVHFCRREVQVADRGSAELELAAWFKRDCLAIPLSANQRALLCEGLPPVPLAQGLEDLPDLLVGQPPVI